MEKPQVFYDAAEKNKKTDAIPMIGPSLVPQKKPK